jgi:hypothetical protein
MLQPQAIGIVGRQSAHRGPRPLERSDDLAGRLLGIQAEGVAHMQHGEIGAVAVIQQGAQLILAGR